VNPTIEDRVTWLTNIQTQLVSNLEEVQRWYKKNVDKHHKNQPNFKVGNQIWFQWQNIKITRFSKKKGYQKLDPFTIMKQINTVTFQLKLLDSMKIHMFHVSLLKPYHVSTIPRRIHKPPPPIVVDGEQKYKVEEILGSRISHCHLRYLIHWQSYDINERTWEPIKNPSNAMEKLKEFHMWYSNKPKAAPCRTHC
jgi:hypothetical protein